MIKFVKGDFFEYKADIRINTVNCAGVMGAGVALEFKNKYPEMFKEYVDCCKRNEIEPGKPFVWEHNSLFEPCIIVNLPTKIHWKNPSEYEYIKENLKWLRKYLLEQSSEVVVTLPALGCGHGGLNWNIVKNEINHYLGDINVEILVFEPSSSNELIENYNLRLLESNITTIYPEDKEYPSCLNNSSAKEIYCKGNVDLLKNKRLSLIFGNSVSEREISSVCKILEELDCENLSIVLSLNNKKQLEVAKILLDKGYKLVLVIPYGILKLIPDVALNNYREQYMVLSYLQPVQEFKRYEYINSLKIRLKLANAILCCCENVEDIRKSSHYLKGYHHLFYIKYWDEPVQEYLDLNATRIGINRVLKKPNVTYIQQVLNEVKPESFHS